jgi:hypothetical protein
MPFRRRADIISRGRTEIGRSPIRLTEEIVPLPKRGLSHSTTRAAARLIDWRRASVAKDEVAAANDEHVHRLDRHDPCVGIGDELSGGGPKMSRAEFRPVRSGSSAAAVIKNPRRRA